MPFIFHLERVHTEDSGETKGRRRPDIARLYYYWASKTYKVIYWVSQFYNSHGPVWAEMEQVSFNPVSLISLLCASLPVSKANLTTPLGLTH